MEFYIEKKKILADCFYGHAVLIEEDNRQVQHRLFQLKKFYYFARRDFPNSPKGQFLLFFLYSQKTMNLTPKIFIIVLRVRWWQLNNWITFQFQLIINRKLWHFDNQRSWIIDCIHFCVYSSVLSGWMKGARASNNFDPIFIFYF